MINETTFRSASTVDRIYKDIIKPYMQKPGQRVKYVDITSYVKNLISPFTNVVKVSLRISQHNSPKEGLAFLKTGGKKIDMGKESQIGKKSVPYGDIRKFSIWLYGLYEKKITNNLINQIKDDLTHEITHLIDVLRREGDPQKFIKRGGYFRLPDEMNAAIHELKRVRKRDRKNYDDIDTINELIDYFEDNDNESLIRLGEYMRKLKWQKKILSRMYRERLLPPALMIVPIKKNLPEAYSSEKNKRVFGKEVRRLLGKKWNLENDPLEIKYLNKPVETSYAKKIEKETEREKKNLKINIEKEHKEMEKTIDEISKIINTMKFKKKNGEIVFVKISEKRILKEVKNILTKFPHFKTGWNKKNKTIITESSLFKLLFLRIKNIIMKRIKAGDEKVILENTMDTIERIKKLWEAKKKKPLKPGEKRFAKSILAKKDPKDSEMRIIDKEKEKKKKTFKDIAQRAKSASNPDAYEWGTKRKVIKRMMKKKGKSVKPE